MTSFLWYDLETYGLDTARNPIVQFAAIRTDEDLKPLAKIDLMCNPPPDMEIEPISVKVHKISPLRAQAQGLPERDFTSKLYDEFTRPNTCSVGYNSLSFDNEFIRFLFFRNFFPPYWHEFKNGCSKWDLLNLARLVALLSPKVLNIENREESAPSFALSNLAAMNELNHEKPHNAMSDVEALLGLAAKIRKRSPEWYNHFFSLRHKQKANEMISSGKPLIYVAGEFSRYYHCASIIIPVITHPVYHGYVICFDLRYSVSEFLKLNPENIRLRYFYDSDEERQDNLPSCLGLVMVRVNKCPALVPWPAEEEENKKETLLEAMKLDKETTYAHVQEMKKSRAVLAKKLRQAFYPDHRGEKAKGLAAKKAGCHKDMAEEALYKGFIDNQDIETGKQVRSLSEEGLLKIKQPLFKDDRLNKILLRYKARNAPSSLSETERREWRNHVSSFNAQTLSGKIAKAKELLDEAREAGDEETAEPLTETLEYFNSLRAEAD